MVRTIPKFVPVMFLLLAASCASTPKAENTAKTGYDPQANAVQVTVADTMPVRAAELVSPTGQVIAAPGIDTQRQAYSGGSSAVTPSIGLGLGGIFGGRHSAFGTSLGVGLGGGSPASDYPIEVISSAAIPVPDPAAYRQDWKNYRIRVQVGDPPTSRVVTIRAPAPG